MDKDEFKMKTAVHGCDVAWSQEQLDRIWTATETRLLSVHYTEHGPNWDGWPLVLPRRSMGALRSKAVKLGLCSVDRWTGAEEEALRRHYPERGALWDGWAEVLPNRSLSQIRGKAAHMGLKIENPGGRGKPPWSAEEDAFLIENREHGKDWDGWGEGLPGRSWDAVKLRARRIGTSIGRGGHGAAPWAKEDDEKLAVVLAKAALALGRTEEAVADRMRTLALRNGGES